MMKSSYADDEGCQYNILVHINLCAINFDIHLLDYVIIGWLNEVFFIFLVCSSKMCVDVQNVVKV